MGDVERRLAAAACLAVSLTACNEMYLYRVADDQQAQAAKKAYSEADLRKSIDSERKASAALADREQIAVARDQRSLRDRTLVALLVNTQREQTWDVLLRQIDTRLEALIGKSKGEAGDPKADLGQQLDSYLDGLTRTQIKLEPARQTYRLATKGKVVPTCPIQASQRPKADELELQIAFRSFEGLCKDVTDYQAQIKGLIEPGSLLGRKDEQLAAVAAEIALLQDATAQASSEYESALAETNKTSDPGKLEAAAAALKEKLDNVETLPAIEHVTDAVGKVEKLPFLKNLKADPILSRFLAQGAQEKTLKQKQLIDSALEALQGRASADATPQLKVVARVSDLEKAITSDSYVQLSAFVLQAEFLRLKASAIDGQIVRAKERVDLFKKQRSAIVDEILFLVDARKKLRSYERAGCPRSGALYDDYRKGPQTCKADLAGALASVSTAWTLGRLENERLEYKVIGQAYEAALDDSEIAIMQADALLRIPIEQVAKAYASGIRPEDLGNLIHALGFSAIAVRVK